MNLLRVTFLLILCSFAFAKDKKDEAKPAVDPKIQVDILKNQRDYANLARSVMPQEIELSRREQQLKTQIEEAQKECGEVTKWKLNPTSLECEEVKAPQTSQPEPPKQEKP